MSVNLHIENRISEYTHIYTYIYKNIYKLQSQGNYQRQARQRNCISRPLPEPEGRHKAPGSRQQYRIELTEKQQRKKFKKQIKIRNKKRTEYVPKIHESVTSFH